MSYPRHCFPLPASQDTFFIRSPASLIISGSPIRSRILDIMWTLHTTKNEASKCSLFKLLYNFTLVRQQKGGRNWTLGKSWIRTPTHLDAPAFSACCAENGASSNFLLVPGFGSKYALQIISANLQGANLMPGVRSEKSLLRWRRPSLLGHAFKHGRRPLAWFFYRPPNWWQHSRPRLHIFCQFYGLLLIRINN